MKSELTITPKGDTLIMLEGKALEPKHPDKLLISGRIESIGDYLKARRATAQLPGSLQHIDKDLAVITMNEDNMSIHLDVDPNNPFGTEVVGKLEMNPDLQEFHINQKHRFSQETLKELLKFSKRFFEAPDRYAEVMAAIQRLNVQSTAVIKSEADSRGNKDAGFKKSVSSETIPEDFILLMPIFKGQPARSFRVDICLDTTEGSVRFWLESTDLPVMKEADMKAIFNKQVEGYLDFAIIWK